MKLTFKINILSDYHIGAGYGSGIIDSALLKDKDGLPVIRGTTLSGLLRQGMWELLQLPLCNQLGKCNRSDTNSKVSYCSTDDINSMCPVCRILGTPAYAKRWSISSAKIEDSKIVTPEKIVWRSRVSPRTRTAEARKLFREESAGKEVNFVFTVSKESNDKQTLEEASFIVASFRMVRNLGSSRRRGKGHCQIHLIDVTPDLEKIKDTPLEDYFLNNFRTKWLENNELEIPEKTTQIELKEDKPQTKSFRVILLTEEPLLIANRGESGNRYHTNIYIPGQTLLGALAWKVAKNCNLNDEDVYEKFIKLFRRGEVKVSPLYPLWKLEDNVHPSIPSPQDFLTCKLFPEFSEDGHGVKGCAIEKDEPKCCEVCLKGEKEGEEGFEVPLEPLNKFLPIHEKAKAIDVALREEMHITIDPETGRTRLGDLFSYISLESGQYFNGCIEIKDWANFATLTGINENNENITFNLRIGKASSRGYGKVKIWLQPEENHENIFIGKPIEERVTDLTQPLTMTLITDAILVDNWGRFLNTLDEKLLKKLLGVNVEEINVYVKSKNIDGFNTFLGLPKWRDVGITAGSSIGFKIKNPNNKDELLNRLRELEREGIGLRKEEGFGRISFNHPIYSKNKGVTVRILLPEYMRGLKRKDAVRSFERRWKQYLKENIDKKDFINPKWTAISRWLRTNAKKSIEEIKKELDSFHTLEKPIKDLIKQKQAYRDKKAFLEERKKGLNSLLASLDKLLGELQSEDERLREYLKIKAIEILADYIATFIKEGEK